MNPVFRAIGVLLLAGCWLAVGFSVAHAKCSTPKEDADLVVAIRDARPFTYLEDGYPQGLALDIWSRVERALPKKLETTEYGFTNKPQVVDFISCDTIDEQEAAMHAGRAHVVISPLTITAERMARYDFSQQYLSSGLALALPETGAIDFEHATETILDTLFQPSVARAIVLFLLFNLLMAVLIRRLLLTDAQGLLGIRAIFEAFMRTIGLRGVGDDFTTPIAKLLEIFMAIVGTALSATILGVLTSAFLSAVGEDTDVAPAAFTKMRIATLKCSTAQTYLYDQYAALKTQMPEKDSLMPVLEARLDWMACAENTPIEGPAEMSEETGLPGAVVLTRSWEAAVGLLARGEVDAVLGDWVALTYESRKPRFEKLITVQDQVYRNEPYGWAIARRPGSDDLRRAIDTALISQMRNVNWRRRLENHLGSGSVAPN